MVILFGEGWEAILRGSWFFLSDEDSFPYYYTTGREGFSSTLSASHSLHLPNLFLMLIYLFIYSF